MCTVENDCPAREFTLKAIRPRSRRRVAVPVLVGILQQRMDILVREDERLERATLCLVAWASLHDQAVLMLPQADVLEALLIEERSDGPQQILIVGL
jgi:hypothetical protein